MSARNNISSMNGNIRRPNNNPRCVPPSEKPTNAQHEEIIKYIHDSWSKVYQEAESNSSNGNGTPKVIYYSDVESNNLQNFKPFDLEAFWGRRVAQNYNL